LSSDVKGGIDYALLKNFYDADDYPALFVNAVNVLNGIPFTATETFYTVGLCAFANDVNVYDIEKGWTLFTHAQPNIPALGAVPIAVIRAVLAATLGSAWPTAVPAFEAKDLLFWADQDCWIRFEGSSRVRHYIPANTYMRFHRRCFKFYVIRDTADGTLRAWMEG